jgi:hypothetical protein
MLVFADTCFRVTYPQYRLLSQSVNPPGGSRSLERKVRPYTMLLSLSLPPTPSSSHVGFTVSTR